MADKLVKVSSNDTTSDFLGEKLVAGNRVQLSTLNASGDEQLEVNASTGIVNLIPLWGNTDLTASPEGTNPGRNFRVFTQSGLVIQDSGWETDVSATGHPSLPVAPSIEESHFYVTLNNTSESNLVFFTWAEVALVSNTSLDVQARMRFDASLGSGTPQGAIWWEDKPQNFNLVVITNLTNSFQQIGGSASLSGFSDMLHVGWAVVMPAGARRRIQVDSFWCEFEAS